MHTYANCCILTLSNFAQINMNTLPQAIHADTGKSCAGFVCVFVVWDTANDSRINWGVPQSVARISVYKYSHGMLKCYLYICK